MEMLVLLLRAAWQTALIYFGLIVALSTIGRRQMLQVSLLDYLIIALLGSAVETGLYVGTGSFWAGLVSVSTLLTANLVLTRSAARGGLASRLLRDEPVLLAHDGCLVTSNLRRVHLTREDVLAAMRLRGFDRLEGTRFVVMEPNGEITVVPRPGSDSGE